MKKIKRLLFLFSILFFHQLSSHATPVATTTIDPSGKNGLTQFHLESFVKMNTKDFQKLTGKKMNLFEKIAFRITKAKMKHYLKKHNNVTVAEYFENIEKEKAKFDFMWFVIGLLSPFIGLFLLTSVIGLLLFTAAPIVIFYATKQSKTKEGSLWAGIGLAAIFFLILAAIASASVWW